MPKKGHTEEQIVAALQQAENGEKVEEVCRRMGMSQATYYSWKKQYAGLGIAELRELRQLRDENARRELGKWAQAAYRISERRAARLMRLVRSSQRYESRRDPQEGLRRKLKDLAATAYNLTRIYSLVG